MKLLSFGDILFDVFPDGAHLGGAPLNLAAHASLQGMDAYVLSALGNDELGEKALDQIQSFGVKTDYVFVSDCKETGKCMVTFNESGAPKYELLTDVAYDYIPYPNLNEDFDLLCFGTLPLRSDNNFEVVKKLTESDRFKNIYCDLNIRPPFSYDRAVKLCLESADFVKISDEELPAVTRAAFGRELDSDTAIYEICKAFPNIKILLLTLGADGSIAYDAENDKLYRRDAEPATVVSTVGAGDSFGASFLSQYFSGKSIDCCLDYASKVSAYVVSNEGALPSGMKEFIKTI